MNDLVVICTNGRTQLQLWKNIFKFFANNKDIFMLSPTYFAFSRDSLLECAVSNLIKMFDSHEDSYSIPTFLNLIEQNVKKIFQSDVLDKIKVFIREDQKKLISKREVLKRLKIWRDKRLFHLEREYAGDLNKVFRDFNLTIGDFDALFEVATEILNRYSKYYNGQTNWMIHLSIDRDIENLINQLTSRKTDEIIERLRGLSKQID